MFGQLKWLKWEYSVVCPTNKSGKPPEDRMWLLSAHIKVLWIANILKTKSQRECNIKYMSCGGLTSRGCWSQHDPSSATQGRSLLMSWDFQRDQTLSPPSSLHRSLSGSSAQWYSQCSGLGCRLGPPPPADSSSLDCCPKRCGPESGTECRTLLCWRARGPPVQRQRRRRCRCRGSRRCCSSTDTEYPGKSATSQRWSGLRQTFQRTGFEPEQCLRADAPGWNRSPDKPAGLWAGS